MIKDKEASLVFAKERLNFFEQLRKYKRRYYYNKSSWKFFKTYQNKGKGI